MTNKLDPVLGSLLDPVLEDHIHRGLERHAANGHRTVVQSLGAAWTAVNGLGTHSQSFQSKLAQHVMTGRCLVELANTFPDDLGLLGALCFGALDPRSIFENPMESGPEIRFLAGTARWAQYHFPVLRLTAAQACSLALSDLTDEQLGEVTTPWPAFAVHFGDAFATKDVAIVLAFVCHSRSRLDDDGFNIENQWNLVLELDTHRAVHLSTKTTADLFRRNASIVDQSKRFRGSAPVGKEEQQMCWLAHRAIVNACFALASKSADVRGIARKKVRHRRDRGRVKDIVAATSQYALGLPVTVDIRAQVRSYLRGEGERLCKVRWVVRGHWRNQAHGPGRKLRKQLWIEPHWSGPKEAPKLVRGHQLRSEDGSGQ